MFPRRIVPGYPAGVFVVRTGGFPLEVQATKEKTMSTRAHDSSRRSFLKLSAALAGAATIAGRMPAFAADAPGADYGGLPMGIQSYTLRDMAFDKALDTIANELKLKYVEIYPGHHTGQSPQQVKEKLTKRGLQAVA